MSAPERPELVRSAVAFLSDPNAQTSPLTQRIQFLEAKGLTAQEIEVALKQASSNTTPFYPKSYVSPYGSPFKTGQWDWRDYFITFVISGSVAYGAVSLFRKYLLPHLQPPTSTAYEADLDTLTAQFDAAEVLLKEIQGETAAVRAAVEEQKSKVDKAIEDVEAAVAELREGELRNQEKMQGMRDEVDSIRDMLPKMMENTKDSHNQSLIELQQELKSLKSLLLTLGPSHSSALSTPAPTLPGRPSIPAWQLAGSSGSVNGLASESTLPTPSFTEPVVKVV